MEKVKNLAEFYKNAEDSEINNAIATLERIRMERQNMFVLIEASKLSETDKFMRHVPQTERQSRLKSELKFFFCKKCSDFWKPIVDPSFNANHSGIRYEFGQKPAIGEFGFECWQKAAKSFWPERKSRLGTRREYVAFLGVLIKKLVESGYDIEDAWYEVCDNSSNLGKYKKELGDTFSDTGEFEICGFYDLANTYKIVESEEEKPQYFYVGGSALTRGAISPLSTVRPYDFYAFDTDKFAASATGWIILEKGEE